MKTILLLIGTRPEAIKLAPVIKVLKERDKEFNCLVCSTGQHHEMLTQALSDFSIKPDYNLELMQKGQTLASLSSKLFDSVDSLINKTKPDWVLVQGDTTTAMVGSLCAFYREIKVGHVEAGLRSFDISKPFPEEANRRVISVVANKHFVPTKKSYDNLIREHVNPHDIIISGNTVIDALLWMINILKKSPPNLPNKVEDIINKKQLIVLITGHRRESFGDGFLNICNAIKELAINYKDCQFIYPVHLNPNVQKPVNEILEGTKNVTLLPPLDYKSFVWLMDKSDLILSDSGGIQEEAPSLGKMVLVMRDNTERPEGVEAGVSLLIGTEKENIINHVSNQIELLQSQKNTNIKTNPYGDGDAAEIIVDNLN
jgi:UDP-N-acetylglucosamine 2-epimerase